MKSSVSAITFSPCSSVQQRSSRPSDTTDQLPHQNSNWCGGQRGPGGWGEGIGAQRGKARLPCVRCLYTFSFTIWTILKLKFNDVVISLAYEKKKKNADIRFFYVSILFMLGVLYASKVRLNITNNLDAFGLFISHSRYVQTIYSSSIGSILL